MLAVRIPGSCILYVPTGEQSTKTTEQRNRVDLVLQHYTILL